MLKKNDSVDLQFRLELVLLDFKTVHIVHGSQKVTFVLQSGIRYQI